ncbi:MAG: LPXTG cell wall anchor domain-containing protein, partial [Akkermansiaceae bacterium]|nr:LPXTG cell wall anchor domain-containing protein [Armatimonadota bacterium]
TGVYSLAITPVVVPEAGTLPLLVGGVMTAGLGMVARRRFKK